MSNKEDYRGTSQFRDARVQSEDGMVDVIKRRPSSHTKGADLISTKPVRRESEGPKPILEVHAHIAEGLEAGGFLEEAPTETQFFNPAEGE